MHLRISRLSINSKIKLIIQNIYLNHQLADRESAYGYAYNRTPIIIFAFRGDTKRGGRVKGEG